MQKPYIYVKARRHTKHVVRVTEPGGEVSICLPLPNGGLVDYTLELTSKRIVLTTGTPSGVRQVLFSEEIPQIEEEG